MDALINIANIVKAKKTISREVDKKDTLKISTCVDNMTKIKELRDRHNWYYIDNNVDNIVEILTNKQDPKLSSNIRYLNAILHLSGISKDRFDAISSLSMSEDERHKISLTLLMIKAIGNQVR